MTPGPTLRDIHLPGEPSWWPPAPGWWLLALLLLVAGFLGALRLRHMHRRWRSQAALRREFDALRADHPSQSDAAAQVAALSLLLRRASKLYAPQALRLKDESWLQFLDADDDTRPFSTGPGRLLLDAPYRARVEPQQAEALASLVAMRLDRFVLCRRA